MTEQRGRKGRPLLITNNARCAEQFAGRCACICDESWTYGEVLTEVRDKIHMGYHLLTHPLAGSMKPNQTPYKSVLLAEEAVEGMEEFGSLELIERALETWEKFQRQRPTPQWAPKVRKDFGTIDISMMQGVFDRTGFAVRYGV